MTANDESAMCTAVVLLKFACLIGHDGNPKGKTNHFLRRKTQHTMGCWQITFLVSANHICKTIHTLLSNLPKFAEHSNKRVKVKVSTKLIIFAFSATYTFLQFTEFFVNPM
jgi:hypothetical protein